MRRFFLIVLKATVSLFLLYLSARSVDFVSLGARLRGLAPEYLVLALVLLIGQVGLVALRWRAIAIACHAAMSRASALQMNFIASFFNQVLPSSVGGDAVRIFILGRKTGTWAGATYSVLIDRVFGVFFLALLVLCCLPWSLELIADPLARAFLILIGTGFVAGFGVFVGLAFAPPAFERFAPLRHLVQASRMLRTLMRKPYDAALVTGCSVLVHGMTVAVAWCCLKAVAAPAGFAAALFLMPPVLLITTIPISIAGWGVRETSMVVAFGYAGLAQGDGLALSILFGITNLVVGVIGGAVWIASGLKVTVEPPPPV